MECVIAGQVKLSTVTVAPTPKPTEQSTAKDNNNKEPGKANSTKKTKKKKYTGPKPETASGEVYVSSAVTGDVFRVDNLTPGQVSKKTPNLSLVLNTGGAPSGMSFDDKGLLYMADMAHNRVLKLEDGKVLKAMGDGGDKKSKTGWGKKSSGTIAPKHGVNALAVDQESGYVFLTDGGPLGSTSLHSEASGGIFAISPADPNNMMVVIPSGLHGPSGIAVAPRAKSSSKDGKNKERIVLYVTELWANRILRLTAPSEVGPWYSSVWATFNGRVGPTGITVSSDNSTVWVAHYDWAGLSDDTGLISILSTSTGAVLHTISVPGAPSLVSVTLAHDFAWVVDAASNSLYQSIDRVSGIVATITNNHPHKGLVRLGSSLNMKFPVFYDDETREAAAVKIQSQVRGMIVRKKGRLNHDLHSQLMFAGMTKPNPIKLPPREPTPSSSTAGSKASLHSKATPSTSGRNSPAMSGNKKTPASAVQKPKGRSGSFLRRRT